jgi:hypothetical protein
MPGTGSRSVAASTRTTGSFRRQGIPVKSYRRKQQRKSSLQPLRSASSRNPYASELSKMGSSCLTNSTRKKGAIRAAVQRTKQNGDDSGSSGKEAFIFSLLNEQISEM